MFDPGEAGEAVVRASEVTTDKSESADSTLIALGDNVQHLTELMFNLLNIYFP